MWAMTQLKSRGSSETSIGSPAASGADGGRGAGAFPEVDFAVPVRKGKSGPAIVPGSRQPDPFRIIAAIDKVAVRNAVGVLVEKHEDAGGSGHGGQPEELHVARIIGIDA